MCVDVDSRLSGIFFFLMYMYCIFTNVVLDMLDTFFKNYIEENPENLVFSLFSGNFLPHSQYDIKIQLYSLHNELKSEIEINSIICL